MFSGQSCMAVKVLHGSLDERKEFNAEDKLSSESEIIRYAYKS